MEFLKKILVALTPNKLIRFFGKQAIFNYKKANEFLNLSYAQEGEDLILNRFLNYKSEGFFIDIGAHHPKRFSNTFIFYKKGWRGINIDPMPGIMSTFNRERPRDINLEIGISEHKGELTYYMFNEPALNTFSKIEAYKKNGLRNYKIIDEQRIETWPLKLILEKHCPKDIVIDFITIDVEGLDLEVLRSNDWDVYRPKMVLIEDLKRIEINDLLTDSDVYNILNSEGYKLVAKTFNTLFFKDNQLK